MKRRTTNMKVPEEFRRFMKVEAAKQGITMTKLMALVAKQNKDDLPIVQRIDKERGKKSFRFRI